jgi:hypothetical protein
VLSLAPIEPVLKLLGDPFVGIVLGLEAVVQIESASSAELAVSVRSGRVGHVCSEMLITR